MATIINNRSTLTTDPIRNFRFLVTFSPHVDSGWDGPKNMTMGFTSVSGMAVTTDSIPYREGGYNTTVHQIPGQTTFAPITLQRGVVLGSRQNWDWMRHLFRTVQGSATANTYNSNFRCDLEVAVLSHPIPGSGAGAAVSSAAEDDHVSLRFKVYNAWPTSVAYSDLNAGDNALFVEQVTLVHEGFDLNWAPSLQTSAPTSFPQSAAITTQPASVRLK
jgi:phage tail-like protein